MSRFSFFHFFPGKCRVGLATRDEPMIYPWRTRDYPVTTRDISKKTRDFGGKPGNVQPVIYPWQTRDLPVTTRDFFTGSNVPPMHWKYSGNHFFWKKRWDLPETINSERFACSIRTVCMFDSKFEFWCYSGIPAKALFGTNLAIDCFKWLKKIKTLCKSAMFKKHQFMTDGRIQNSYHHDPPRQCAIWDPFSTSAICHSRDRQGIRSACLPRTDGVALLWEPVWNTLMMRLWIPRKSKF